MIDNEISLKFGKNLKELRIIHKLTQEKFASLLNKELISKYFIRANYDSKSISNWEQGKSLPKMEVLIAICKKYNISLDEIFSNTIENLVEKSVYSYSEETILDELKTNKDVCIKNGSEYISSWNEKMYKYGKLSYLADNLIEYKGSLSRHFEVVSPQKQVQVLVGIIDNCDGKWTTHYIGNEKNDIKSVQNIPNSVQTISVKNNDIINALMISDVFNSYDSKIVQLHNGKNYILNGNKISTEDKGLKFDKDNVPNDLEKYGLNSNDYDYTDYATLKAHNMFDEKLFELESSSCVYYKDINVFGIYLFGEMPINISDEQLVKVLADDYKHRLIRALSKVSDENMYNKYVLEIQDYDNQEE